MRISDWSSDVCSSDLVREDDLPGSQAPAAWLQYLRGGSSSQLKPVAAHNHQDVVTLAALMAEPVNLPAADADQPRSRFEPCGAGTLGDSEAGRVGEEYASTCRSRWAPDP